MKKQWFINNDSQVEHRITGEVAEFGYGGSIYDITKSFFRVAITDILVAGAIIRENKSRYQPDTKLIQGEELTAKLPIEDLEAMRDALRVQDLTVQLAIANRQ